MAIILDNTVYSAPVIQERIGGGRAQITGSFSTEEANDLAIILRAGALPAPVKIIQDLTVGPSLGRDSIEKGVRSTVIAGTLAVLFMVVYYRPWVGCRSSMTCSTGGGGWNGSASRSGYVRDPRQNVLRFHGAAEVLLRVLGRPDLRRPDRACPDLAGGGEPGDRLRGRDGRAVEV